MRTAGRRGGHSPARSAPRRWPAPSGSTPTTVTQHLKGDFPGGTVDLHYRFTLDQGLISRLDIAP
ncbi:hypothetical protein [Streptomyces sp. KE1]|uniref:hypothetical protein n=1 Tax=Streptomyces sp. KE1 TaxID=1638939 RepID=UPI001F425D9E|nr:hypothetical protein [Streptomyces sp. KE1]